MEAWELSYANGNRVIDADLTFTSDGILVLRHSWNDNLEQDNISVNNVPAYEEFINTKIYYKYTPMSCYDMLEFMNEHVDLYVACDFKDGEADTFEFLVNAARSMDCENVLDRIIVSFYSYDDYEEVNKVYNFQNWAIRQYESEQHNYYELAEFCLMNNIPVCMVWKSFLEAGDDITVLTDNGIKVYMAVENSLMDLEGYMQLGVSGCVSDFIVESDLTYIQYR